MPTNAPFSEFPGQARQQVDVLHRLDRLFCARPVPIIAVPFPVRRTASGSMHPTDTTAANRRRTTALPCSFRFSFAPRRVVGALSTEFSSISRRANPRETDQQHRPCGLAPEYPVGISEQKPKPCRRDDNQRDRRDKIQKAILHHQSQARLGVKAAR